ncbi:hypothetical protein U8335_20885 [Roseiconus lacunae]|uniref:hypothetical protein n=1 Tax=Roseiconus lacunae TaxID=2605694 RepID=UPI003086854D|nr:hypothetical protein U8335_20885 [Stieleria sp. HD01]
MRSIETNQLLSKYRSFFAIKGQLVTKTSNPSDHAGRWGAVYGDILVVSNPFDQSHHATNSLALASGASCTGEKFRAVGKIDQYQKL